MYKIHNFETSSEHIRHLTSITSTELLTLRSIWPSTEQDDFRYLFEHCMGQAGKMLDLEAWSYESLSQALVGYFWGKAGMDSHRTYDWLKEKDRLGLVVKTYKKEQPYEIALEILMKNLVGIPKP